MRTNDQVIAEFRRNAGHVGGELARTPILLLHHVGARSGMERVTPLGYQRLCGGLVIVGSNGASPVDPAWCHNLRARPRVVVEVGADAFPARGRELDDAARDAIWPTLVVGAPTLGEYQAQAARPFPVFLLTPEAPPA